MVAYAMTYAPVVQWIELWTSKPLIEVRFLSGAKAMAKETTFVLR